VDGVQLSITDICVARQIVVRTALTKTEMTSPEQERLDDSMLPFHAVKHREKPSILLVAERLSRGESFILSPRFFFQSCLLDIALYNLDVGRDLLLMRRTSDVNMGSTTRKVARVTVMLRSILSRNCSAVPQ
jgi:hypothetical protein